MQRKRISDIAVTDTAVGGKGLARHDGMVIFIEDAVPGDVVEVEIYKKKKAFMEGRMVNLIQPSENRIEPFCRHFSYCGGCRWQHLTYEAQLHFKEEHIRQSLIRLAKVELPEINPIMAAQKTQLYRNKLEFSFTQKRWLTNEEMSAGIGMGEPGLGFHIPGRFDKIFDLKECFLQEDPSNEIRNEVGRFAKEKGYSFFNPITQEGMLRSLLLRTSSTGEIMVMIMFRYDQAEEIAVMMDRIKDSFPAITSLLYTINTKKNDTYHDLDIKTWHGKDHILEEMEGLKFRIGPKTFYQTNSEQAYNLYKITRDYAAIKKTDIVYDLYTGAGTIANFVSPLAKKVIGIEYVEDAIADAKVNSEINKISNTDFYAGDMKAVLNDEFIAKHGKPDVIITDPPRAGMDEQVIHKINELKASRVVYVSCNPGTQARDLALLDEVYKVSAVQPIDMFPHTDHSENVVLLELR